MRQSAVKTVIGRLLVWIGTIALIYGIGSVFGFLGLFVLFGENLSGNGTVGEEFARMGSALPDDQRLPVFACLILGWPFRRIGLRLIAAAGWPSRTECSRAPVLFLRPFSTDTIGILSVLLRFWRAYPEEKLAVALEHVGPLIAVGRPGEILPRQTGAFREYVEGDDWQVIVQQKMREARIVVIRVPGKGTLSGGVQWEIDEAIRSVKPEHLLLFLPYQGSWGRERQYNVFREYAQPYLKHSLPEKIGRAEFIVFDADFRPTEVSVYPLTWKMTLSSITSNLRYRFLGRNLSPLYRTSLSPFFDALGIECLVPRFTFAEKLLLWCAIPWATIVILPDVWVSVLHSFEKTLFYSFLAVCVLVYSIRRYP